MNLDLRGVRVICYSVRVGESVTLMFFVMCLYTTDLVSVFELVVIYSTSPSFDSEFRGISCACLVLAPGCWKLGDFLVCY